VVGQALDASAVAVHRDDKRHRWDPEWGRERICKARNLAGDFAFGHAGYMLVPRDDEVSTLAQGEIPQLEHQLVEVSELALQIAHQLDRELRGQLDAHTTPRPLEDADLLQARIDALHSRIMHAPRAFRELYMSAYAGEGGLAALREKASLEQRQGNDNVTAARDTRASAIPASATRDVFLDGSNRQPGAHTVAVLIAFSLFIVVLSSVYFSPPAGVEPDLVVRSVLRAAGPWLLGGVLIIAESVALTRTRR
jgi:hypothetical protein